MTTAPVRLALTLTTAALTLPVHPAATHTTAAPSTHLRIVVQHAPLAGFVYYDGREVWERLGRGERLTLVREPANAHDPNAVRLEWRGHMLGYVPRRDNADLARQMDHGARPVATITDIGKAANGRHRIAYEISIPLHP